MKRKYGIAAVFGISLCLLGAFLEPRFSSFFTPSKRNPHVYTMQYLKNLDQSIQYLEKVRASDVDDYFMVQNSGDDLNERLVATFEKLQFHTGVAMTTNEQKLFLDGWGRPFRFVLQGSTEVTNVSSRLAAQYKNVIIWSIGPDGIDNWGGGDDLFLKAADRDTR